MRVVAAFFASLARLLSRPLAPLSVLAVLALLAAAGTLPLAPPALSVAATRTSPIYGPQGLDLPLLGDLAWGQAALRQPAGVAWGLLVLIAIALFALTDALLVRAACGPWAGARRTTGALFARAPALLAIAAVAAGWAALVRFATIGLLGGRIERLTGAVSSEWRGLLLGLLPDLLWALLVLPMLLAADLARARVALEERRSGLLALAWAIDRVARSLRPWLAAALALFVDLALIAAAAASRPRWDPRLAPSLAGSLLVVLLILLARILVHGAYLGALGRTAVTAPAPPVARGAPTEGGDGRTAQGPQGTPA